METKLTSVNPMPIGLEKIVSDIFFAILDKYELNAEKVQLKNLKDFDIFIEDLDSLIAISFCMDLLYAIEKKFGVEIPINNVKTIQEIVAYLNKNRIICYNASNFYSPDRS